MRAGNRVAPLLLDDDEVLAVGAALSVSAGSQSQELSEASMRALAKIAAMLPRRLGPRLEALARATTGTPDGGSVAPVVELQTIAAAVQACEQLRFSYVGAGGDASEREVEPYRLVLRAGWWYLVAWDPSRADWRTFRVDRLRVKSPGGRRFEPRPQPAGGYAAYVVRTVETASWQQRYRVRLAAPADEIKNRAPASVEVQPDGPRACVVTVGGESPEVVARYLSWWDVPFEVLDSRALLAAVRALGRRYAAAAPGGSPA